MTACKYWTSKTIYFLDLFQQTHVSLVGKQNTSSHNVTQMSMESVEDWRMGILGHSLMWRIIINQHYLSFM